MSTSVESRIVVGRKRRACEETALARRACRRSLKGTRHVRADLPVWKTSTGRSVDTFVAEIGCEPARAGATTFKHEIQDDTIRPMEARPNIPERRHLARTRQDATLGPQSPMSDDLQ
jgi:hypothetical protein